MDLPRESEIIRRRFRVRRALIEMGVDERDALAGALAWEGKSNSEIGDELNISEMHVGQLLGRIYRVLGFKGHPMTRRMQLIRMFRDSAFHNDLK